MGKWKNNREDPTSEEEDDCITSATKGLEILLGQILRLGRCSNGYNYNCLVEQLGTKGLSDAPITFEFNDREANTAKTPDQAFVLRESIGRYIEGKTADHQVSAFNISLMDGYHVATILYHKVSSTEGYYYWSDQVRGIRMYNTSNSLDLAITLYVNNNAGARTGDGSMYPAKVQINQLKHD